MDLIYKDDEDLHFLQYCSEAQLKVVTALLTHDDKGKQRLASELQHFGEALNSVKAVSGSTCRVTIADSLSVANITV